MDGRIGTVFRLGLPCAALILLAACSGCSEVATLTVAQGEGPQPQLPPPKKTLIPTLNIAPAVHWAAGEAPTPAAGLAVGAFATGLDHPRWLYVLPNGDVLVAETNAPERPDEGKGLRGKIQKSAMTKAGAVTESANRLTLLRDADGDGVAEVRQVFASNLNSPFGMALVGNMLYVADSDAIVRLPYQDGALQAGAAATTVAPLPAGTRNHHWTKNVIASRDGSKLYATVGSNSNVGDYGMEIEAGRAAIVEVDPATGQSRLFATGLRNPNGMGWNPVTGELWTVVNERDEIGSDLVPDYLTSVREGGFYGWPYSYYGQHVDDRIQPQRPDLVAKAIVPDYALGPHTASLGMSFYEGSLFPAHYAGGVFVGQHGSWNRRPPSGYRVVFVPFANGRPSGPVEEVLTGFLDAEGNARGRPVGVAVARDGALLVADDVGNAVWRVSPARP
jgi:glucose/arabinose dehydrogenase